MNSQNTIFFNFIHKNKYLFGLVISILIFINYNLINWVWNDKFIYKKIITINPVISDKLSHNFQNDLITFTISIFNKNSLDYKIKASNLNNNVSFQINFQTHLNFKEASKIIKKLVDNSSEQLVLKIDKELRAMGYDKIIHEKQLNMFKPTKIRLEKELKILRVNFYKNLFKQQARFRTKYNLDNLKIKKLKKEITESEKNRQKNLDRLVYLQASSKKDYNDYFDYQKVASDIIFDDALSDITLDRFRKYINESNDCKIFIIRIKGKFCDDKIEILNIMSRYLAIRFRLNSIKEFSEVNIDKKFNIFQNSFVDNLQTKNILKLKSLLKGEIMQVEEIYSKTKKIAPGKIFILILSIFNSFVLGIVFWSILFKLNWRVYFLKY